MTKPDTIPQDIWETARATFTECRDANAIWSDGSGPAAIARAIMAEREACARVADERVPLWEEVEAVAAAIRNRGTAA